MDRARSSIVAGISLAVIAAAVPLFSGCGSESASATVDSPRGSTPIATNSGEPSQAQTIETAAIASRSKPKPGAKTVVLPRAGDKPYDKTFDDIRFSMTPGEKFKRSMLTKDIEALGGQKIRIRGYILPTAQRSGIHSFVLVRDNQECCFGPGAALYDCILVEMKEGTTANFTIKPVAVEGTFDVRQVELAGKDLAIYHVDGESVQ